MAKKTKKAKVTKGEKLLYTMAVFSLAFVLVLEVFARANITHLNMSIEKMNYEIKEQNKKNESLTMKVNELTSFDKIKEVASDMGLAYNNDNIIVVNR